MTISGLIDELTHGTHYRDQVVRIERLPAREAKFADPRDPLNPVLGEALKTLGIDQLYTHQVAAIDHIRSGEHVVVVTSTASVKTR